MKNETMISRYGKIEHGKNIDWIHGAICMTLIWLWPKVGWSGTDANIKLIDCTISLKRYAMYMRKKMRIDVSPMSDEMQVTESRPAANSFLRCVLNMYVCIWMSGDFEFGWRDECVRWKFVSSGDVRPQHSAPRWSDKIEKEKQHWLNCSLEIRKAYRIASRGDDLRNWSDVRLLLLAIEFDVMRFGMIVHNWMMIIGDYSVWFDLVDEAKTKLNLRMVINVWNLPMTIKLDFRVLLRTEVMPIYWWVVCKCHFLFWW